MASNLASLGLSAAGRGSSRRGLSGSLSSLIHLHNNHNHNNSFHRHAPVRGPPHVVPVAHPFGRRPDHLGLGRRAVSLDLRGRNLHTASERSNTKDKKDTTTSGSSPLGLTGLLCGALAGLASAWWAFGQNGAEEEADGDRTRSSLAGFFTVSAAERLKQPPSASSGGGDNSGVKVSFVYLLY